MKKNKLFYSLVMLPIMFAATSCGNEEQPKEDLVLHSQNLNYTLDIYETTFVVVDLKDTIVEKNVQNLSFSATQAVQGGISVKQTEGSTKVNIFSSGVTGDYLVNVKAFVSNVEKLAYDLCISVIDGAPAPTIKKNLDNFEVKAPKFPHKESTSASFSFNLDEYIDAADNVIYKLDSSVSDDVSLSVSDTKKATLTFNSFGEFDIKINAIFRDEVACSLVSKAIVSPVIDNQLFNGSFESDYDGWDLNEWDKLSYSIYDSEFDIWGNKISSVGKYIYGYANENGKVDFTSSLFKVAGSRYITLKIAGNCTDELYISLMKYVDGGEDIEIKKMNNWYYGKYAPSGFIFTDYIYQIPEEFNNCQCYFKVHDGEDASCVGGFGFINLDEIVTYYASKPANYNEFYDANFKVDPHPTDFDMSDTSKDPFTTTDVPYQLANGDFESGYDHWFMTTADKQAYAIYNSKKDIWQNPVNATNFYLYGYANERHTTTFHSDLFKVGGSGFITFKIAGNNTSDLQFRLKKYVEGGEAVEIAKFNNTYFANGTKDHSGFIFHTYYYQIDLATYKDALCYFEVYDMKTENFGFICLDDIVTYYETEPVHGEDWLKASYITEAE